MRWRPAARHYIAARDPDAHPAGTPRGHYSGSDADERARRRREQKRSCRLNRSFARRRVVGQFDEIASRGGQNRFEIVNPVAPVGLDVVAPSLEGNLVPGGTRAGRGIADPLVPVDNYRELFALAAARFCPPASPVSSRPESTRPGRNGTLGQVNWRTAATSTACARRRAEARAADNGLWGACAFFGQPLNPDPSPPPREENPVTEPATGRGLQPRVLSRCVYTCVPAGPGLRRDRRFQLHGETP